MRKLIHIDSNGVLANEFSGKVVVITGAGSGIGRSLARQLAASGANLALSDIDSAGLDETVCGFPETIKVSTHTFDVSDLEAYRQFVNQVVAVHGGVDMVINNAGIVRLHSIDQGKYEDYTKSIDVNVMGVLYGCKEFLPHLRKRSQAWLVNISSAAGLIGVGHYSSYNLTKFAVRGLTESLRSELRDTNVHVACVHPGGVDTNIEKSGVHSDDARSSAAKLAANVKQMTADQAAAQLLAGLVKKRKRIIIGRDAKIVDIVARLFPAGYEWAVSKYV